MATVVITFFLFAQFYVYKMDAAWIESQRDQFLSRREKRWSMNSQRLEEIVAELMKPVKDDRRNFDTDICALLEEYLTEAGLHALDAAEELEGGAEGPVVPNFPEIALLLQQSVSIYGRKVDFLYDHVLNFNEGFHNSSPELANTSAASEPQTPSASRRRRRPSGRDDFCEIALEPCAGAAREPEAPRPPPTLPRMYVELEPRVVMPGDVPLIDYAADDIGLLSDFHVTWRLHDGMLVDELEGGSEAADRGLRPIPLLELQAAIEAAAPPAPPPLRYDSPPRELTPPLHASTPLPGERAPEPPPPPPPPPSSAVKRKRKRCSDDKIEDMFDGIFRIVVGKYLIRQLTEVQEFSISEKWISNVVRRRKIHILSERKRLLREGKSPEEFAGWSCSEATLALAAVAKRNGRLEADSDDDGFFEQSSVGDIEPRSPPAALAPAPVPAAAPAPAAPAPSAAAADMAAWRAALLQRAAASEARGVLDVTALGVQLLGALRGAEREPRPFEALLRERVRRSTDVSRILLTTLFLANAGNVEIVQGAPLSLNSFSLRLLSTNIRNMSLVSRAEQALLR